MKVLYTDCKCKFANVMNSYVLARLTICMALTPFLNVATVQRTRQKLLLVAATSCKATIS